MYYSLSFPRGNRRRRRRRKEEEQVRDDVGALEHVSTDALDRADDRCRGEGLCGIKFRAPHAIVVLSPLLFDFHTGECIGRVVNDVKLAIVPRRVRRPVPVGVPSWASNLRILVTDTRFERVTFRTGI